MELRCDESKSPFSSLTPLSLLLLVFFFFFQAMPLSAADTSSSNNGDPDGVYGGRSVDPSAGIVIIVLICAFFVVCCIAMYLRGCVDAAAVSMAHSRGRHLLPVSAYGQSYRRASGSSGLHRSEIESLPTFVYSDVKELKIGKATLECAVCITEFDDDETLRLLPKCEHSFHRQCIDAWLTVRSTCPVCRSDLVSVATEIAGGSNFTPTTGRSSGERDGSDEEIPAVGEARRCDVVVPKPNSAVKYLRSNSTGHSLMSAGEENSDRFRLRLPEEVKKRILVDEEIRRAKSYGALPRAPSSRKGYSGGGQGSHDWSGRLKRCSGGRGW